MPSKMLNLGNKAGGFLLGHLHETHHYQPVADLALVSGRAVETAHSASAPACDRVGFKTVSVLHVGSVNFLVLDYSHRLHVVRIERERTFVIKTGFGDFYTMKFRL